MPFQRFLIAPYNSGLITSVKPWLIPDEAFSTLNNAYLYENRVRKKWGHQYIVPNEINPQLGQLSSRLRINIGNTLGPLTIPGTGVGEPNGLSIGQQFSVESGGTVAIFTVNQLGAGVSMLSTVPGWTATINSTVTPETVTFGGATPAGASVFYYPALPVMGLLNYNQNRPAFDETIAFDTIFAYQYNFTNDGWERLGTALWTGTVVDFFWNLNYQGLSEFENFFFVTNNNDNDGIRFWDGAVWTTLNPAINAAGDTLITAKILIQFKNRMLAFNTFEDFGGRQERFVNRVRYSQIGNALDVLAWRQDRGAGNGGFRDAPTQQEIVSVEFVRDRLIVYFENSTWELVYTGSEILPFRWQQVNSELGVQSTYSIVPFDKVAIGVSQQGIHACNGTNVERIDQKIYHEVYNVRNGTTTNFGTQLVYGIRDYFAEQLYWTFPDRFDTTGQTLPFFSSRVFVYNYQSQSWAFFDDSITCFGYFYPRADDTGNFPIVYQAGQQLVIGGNSQGFTFLIHPDFIHNESLGLVTDISISAVPPNDITITSPLHNLKALEDYVYFSNSSGMTGLDGIGLPVLSTTPTTFTVANPIGASGTYLGGGTFTRIPRIDIRTKEYNFYAKDNRNQYVNQVNFMMDRTNSSSFTVDYFVSTASNNMLTDSFLSGALVGTGIVNTSADAISPLESIQTRLWHPTYIQAEGEVIQLRIYYTDLQLLGQEGVSREQQDFQMHAFLFFAQPTGYLR